MYIFHSACSRGKFKSKQGEGPCFPCPPNSQAASGAASICSCRNGYYRADTDSADSPCTSKWRLFKYWKVIGHILIWYTYFAFLFVQMDIGVSHKLCSDVVNVLPASLFERGLSMTDKHFWRTPFPPCVTHSKQGCLLSQHYKNFIIQASPLSSVCKVSGLLGLLPLYRQIVEKYFP